MLKRLERIGRLCYKSEDRITHDSAYPFIKRLIANKHTAMVEHSHMQVIFVTDRGVTHELVRHRLASYAQESTRWCNYGGTGIKVIPPGNIRNHQDPTVYARWLQAMQEDQDHYEFFLGKGLKPGDARSILPTCLKTEIAVSTNFTEWRHIFQMRTAITAHPDMRRLMMDLLLHCQRNIPVVFDDINIAIEEEAIHPHS